MNAIIIGAGVSGLTIAYRLLNAGFGVKIVEQSPYVGGLAAPIELGDKSVDRHFHFFCQGERDFRNMAEELGVGDHLVWGKISRAVMHKGEIHPISTPVDILKFAPLGLADRLRFALNVLKGRHLGDIGELDGTTAEKWLLDSVGETVYETMWKPLLEAKFGNHASAVSAAWLCARQRMQQENIAYLKNGGGSFFVKTLADEVTRLGGEMVLDTAATEIDLSGDRATGITTANGALEAELVVSTLPMPRLMEIASGPISECLKPFSALQYIGVVSTVILLKKPLVPYFWLNTNDPDISFAGVIDLTNLDPERGTKPHVIYVPHYCSTASEAFREGDESIMSRIIGDFPKIGRGFADDWVLDAKVTRDCFAQHVCLPGMLNRIPPPLTAIKGFFMTEWSQFYPNDRSINNSIGIANACAEAVIHRAR